MEGTGNLMEGTGNSVLTAAAPHADALPAAAVPEVLLPEAVFPLDVYPDDAFVGEDLPFDGWDGEIPYDDDLDAAYPASFPEDPFPEALFADVLFTDAASSNAVTMRPRLEDRVAAARALLTADLAADNAGLIDQLHASENVKSMLSGQQARLTVEFEARHRQEHAERGDASSRTLSAEDLGKKRPQEHTTGVAEQIALARGESPHLGGRLLGMAKALVIEMPQAWRPWTRANSMKSAPCIS